VLLILLDLEIEYNLNRLIDYLKEIAEATKQLSKGNYDIEIKPLSPNDVINYNLNILKNNLAQRHKEELEHKKLEQIRAWRNKGVELFIDIIGFKTEDLHEWAYNILKTSVEYLNAVQGGFFILEKDDSGEDYFNLIACYAFNEEKIVTRKVPADSGFFAKIYKTYKILYVEEIPEDYLVISTALGEVKPNTVVLVPLVFNNQLLGAIELDSFNKFEQYQLEFLEEISRHISSSLSTWKITQETKRLLEKTQRQTKQIEEQAQRLEKQLKQLEKVRADYEYLKKEYERFQNATDTLVLRIETDTKGNIIFVNSLFSSLFKRPYNYFIGKSLKEILGFEIITEEQRKRWEQILSGKILKTIEKVSVKLENRTEEIWLTEVFTVVYNLDGTPKKVIILANNITEKVELEKQLRRQMKEYSTEMARMRKLEREIKTERLSYQKDLEYYNTMLEVFDKLIGRLTIDERNYIVDVNDFASQLLGYAPEELIDLQIEKLIVETEREKLNNILKQVVESKKVSEIFNLIRKDGHTIELTLHFIFREKIIDKKTKEHYITILLTKLT